MMLKIAAAVSLVATCNVGLAAQAAREHQSVSPAPPYIELDAPMTYLEVRFLAPKS
jgi:hypothetical protein